MLDWQPIETAPKDRAIDLAAKKWNPHTDLFEVRRFPDCRWFIPPAHSPASSHASANLPPRWGNMDTDYRAVAWMEIPELPEP